MIEADDGIDPAGTIEIRPLIGEAEMLYGREIGSTYQGQRLTLSKHFASQGPLGQLTLAETAPGRARV